MVSIVCSSRSGSTVFKYALCLHPQLSTLAGEEEPYYKLANNGYPWHPSDEFHQANNPELVHLLIANELHNHDSRVIAASSRKTTSRSRRSSSRSSAAAPTRWC